MSGTSTRLPTSWTIPLETHGYQPDLHGSVEHRYNLPGREAPYDTYASTSGGWGLVPKDKTPPAPVFRYSSAVPKGKPDTTLAINFSSTSDETWTYRQRTHTYTLSYADTGPATVLQPDGRDDADLDFEHRRAGRQLHTRTMGGELRGRARGDSGTHRKWTARGPERRCLHKRDLESVVLVGAASAEVDVGIHHQVEARSHMGRHGPDRIARHSYALSLAT